jgi:hypothetical protein
MRETFNCRVSQAHLSMQAVSHRASAIVIRGVVRTWANLARRGKGPLLGCVARGELGEGGAVARVSHLGLWVEV